MTTIGRKSTQEIRRIISDRYDYHRTRELFRDVQDNPDIGIADRVAMRFTVYESLGLLDHPKATY